VAPNVQRDRTRVTAIDGGPTRGERIRRSDMCRRVQCEQCQKPTYAGCGKHIEQALRGVAEQDRCRCREIASAAKLSAVANHGVARLANVPFRT
jgi:hypothetical protein